VVDARHARDNTHGAREIARQGCSASACQHVEMDDSPGWTAVVSHRACKRLSYRSEEPMERDPVCGMQVDPNKAAGSSEYKGKTYYFCAKVCKTKFDASPESYVKQV
jgi:Cu+-exporting ATPase